MNRYVDFKRFRDDVVKALNEVSKTYGLEIKAGNISYDENSFSMKLNCTRTDRDVNKSNFENNLKYMNLSGFSFEPDDYGRIVNIKGRSYTICGFKPGNKYNVILQRDDGAEYGFTARDILKELGRNV